jgi:hypothetical protein
MASEQTFTNSNPDQHLYQKELFSQSTGLDSANYARMNQAACNKARQSYKQFQGGSEKENFNFNFKNNSLEKRLRALERNNLIKEYDQKIRRALRDSRKHA